LPLQVGGQQWVLQSPPWLYHSSNTPTRLVVLTPQQRICKYPAKLEPVRSDDEPVRPFEPQGLGCTIGKSRQPHHLMRRAKSNAALGDYTKESSTKVLVARTRVLRLPALCGLSEGESCFPLPATQDNRNPPVSSAAVCWTQAAAAPKQAERRVGPLHYEDPNRKASVFGGFRRTALLSAPSLTEVLGSQHGGLCRTSNRRCPVAVHQRPPSRSPLRLPYLAVCCPVACWRAPRCLRMGQKGARGALGVGLDWGFGMSQSGSQRPPSPQPPTHRIIWHRELGQVTTNRSDRTLSHRTSLHFCSFLTR